jgi:hypothetical protein
VALDPKEAYKRKLQKKKNRVFSTEMNSNSQNDTSNHQFKLSISSIEETKKPSYGF